ncbi:BZ3500_MvSof-1268-A1-R1_Chr9g10658 [Microbotryum saponariae]|uniref:BZ3500_MvSof-1268-A1-R1_Chr9g10658 protein n=1 Tax=Microbotryum saponariae TaxID=289078 RepID=A0A2X0M700_9BASI|nr:BZ3501_MvSof-1269-A2-R1_Chr9g10406 [Microbotryum saponariae]SDA00470.1 BZ3500_MvSof-1268-A1-R1_Chr9g10658 [Microbotryum saponariae]
MGKEEAPPPTIIPSELSASPDSPLSSLAVQLDVDELSKAYDASHLDRVHQSWRASCYLATAQIFLTGNATMEEKLTRKHIKPRLLGTECGDDALGSKVHMGPRMLNPTRSATTVPTLPAPESAVPTLSVTEQTHYGTTGGLAFAYSHTQALIRRRGEQEAGNEPSFLFITGPGHGAPAILSELYIEGAISKFYPEYAMDKQGLNKFVKSFSWPGGFPSHVNAETPGCIHEGGELGYALAVAYGSVFDKPDLISVVVVGDGESETGPTATAWHSHKWLNPATSGAVLPVLHVNGFKISERTLPGTMDATELALLYTGYGYQVRFVEYEPEGEPTMGGNDPADIKLNRNMAVSIDWAYSEIRRIQKAARSGQPLQKPRWPLLILRSPKGWTGPLTDGKGKQLLNSFASHQVPLPAAGKDDEQLDHLERWLRSYEPEKIFQPEHKLSQGTSILNQDYDSVLPKQRERRLGFVPEAYQGYKALDLGDWKTMTYEKGAEEISCMKAIGKFLADTIKRNPRKFRIFSPDELASNKLDGVFEVTSRAFQWDPETADKENAAVMEMLSEHTLQGWLQGYTLTGRAGVFPSYEAFLGIIATMMIQYAKFTKMALETPWRGPMASLTYIETSTWTRQEHNGYSHQQVGFISSVLSLPVHLARVYLPADANTSVSVISHCLKSKNYINLIIGTKAPSPVFLTPDEAEEHCIAGASVWKSYSTDEGVNPDVVLVGIGFELTAEVIAAAARLRKDFGDNLRVRVVNVVDLLVLAPVGEHPHALSEAGFNSLFPPNTPVVINWHGHPAQIASLLFNRPHSVGRTRFHINGYIEQGSTTTPYLMLKVNKCDRYTVATNALDMVALNFSKYPNHFAPPEKHERVGRVVAQVQQRIAIYASKNREFEKYAQETQQDHPEIGATATLAEG